MGAAMILSSRLNEDLPVWRIKPALKGSCWVSVLGQMS